MEIRTDLASARKNIGKMKDLLKKADSFAEEQNLSGMIQTLFLYEKEAERVVNQARVLLIPFLQDEVKRDLHIQIIEENKVEIRFLDKEIFYLKMPFLLTRKEKGDPSYIRSTAFCALSSFFESHEKKIYSEKVTIVVRHNYTEEDKNYRDHDNIELNSIIDLLALFVLVDDSPLYANHYYLSSVKKEYSTEFFIVPNSKLLEFLKGEDFLAPI